MLCRTMAVPHVRHGHLGLPDAILPWSEAGTSRCASDRCQSCSFSCYPAAASISCLSYVRDLRKMTHMVPLTSERHRGKLADGLRHSKSNLKSHKLVSGQRSLWNFVTLTHFLSTCLIFLQIDFYPCISRNCFQAPNVRIPTLCTWCRRPDRRQSCPPRHRRPSQHATRPTRRRPGLPNDAREHASHHPRSPSRAPTAAHRPHPQQRRSGRSGRMRRAGVAARL
jgi:hypothetical protein